MVPRIADRTCSCFASLNPIHLVPCVCCDPSCSSVRSDHFERCERFAHGLTLVDAVAGKRAPASDCPRTISSVACADDHVPTHDRAHDLARVHDVVPAHDLDGVTDLRLYNVAWSVTSVCRELDWPYGEVRIVSVSRLHAIHVGKILALCHLRKHYGYCQRPIRPASALSGHRGACVDVDDDACALSEDHRHMTLLQIDLLHFVGFALGTSSAW